MFRSPGVSSDSISLLLCKIAQISPGAISLPCECTKSSVAYLEVWGPGCAHKLEKCFVRTLAAPSSCQKERVLNKVGCPSTPNIRVCINARTTSFRQDGHECHSDGSTCNPRTCVRMVCSRYIDRLVPLRAIRWVQTRKNSNLHSLQQ